MSYEVTVHIDDECKPTNIPNHESIIKQSFELRPRQTTTVNISCVRITHDARSDREVGSI